MQQRKIKAREDLSPQASGSQTMGREPLKGAESHCRRGMDGSEKNEVKKSWMNEIYARQKKQMFSDAVVLKFISLEFNLDLF